SEERQLLYGFTSDVGQMGGIVAGEAVVGELRPVRIAFLVTDCAINAVDREEGKRADTDIVAHFFQRVSGSKQSLLLGSVDAIEIRMADRRTRDPHMH